MVGWHHQSNGHEFEQTLEDSGGFPVLVYEVYGVTKSDMMERLNNNNKQQHEYYFGINKSK